MFSESGINIKCLSAITIRAFYLVYTIAKKLNLFCLYWHHKILIINLSDGTVAETTSSTLTKNATTTTAAKKKWADIEVEQH